MFNFDYFINKPCIEIFGLIAKYIPANNNFDPFVIKGNFYQDYKQVTTNSSEAEISSSEIVIFIRDIDMALHYPKANQGDFIEIENFLYQIIDIQPSIPGSKKLILHESPKNSH